MKRFLAFTIKEFRHIHRDTRTLLILFGIPVVEIVIFGYVVTNEIRHVPVVILDKSKDVTTQKITDRILASPWFLEETKVKSEKEIHDLFKRGNVRLAVIFGQDFEKKLMRREKVPVQVIADGSDPNAARLMVGYLTAIVIQAQKDLNKGMDKRGRLFIKSRMEFNPELKGAFMFVPGTIAMILMLISAMMTSISIAREKETGTMEAMLVSPLHPLQIILGKVVPYVVIAFIDAVIIMALGGAIFGVPLKGSLFLLIGEVILFIFLSLSLGIMFSTMSSTQMEAMFLSFFALLLPTVLLSGFIYPVEDMPVALQWFSTLMPARWFIVILKSIMLKGAGFLFVWKETLILAGMTLVFLLVSIKKFTIRLE
ncbi:MAG TPA: ABC transporter permease [Bacteroidetes bacterium]|nr:ABC transporter permease [Bacteroidota bacterium]